MCAEIRPHRESVPGTENLKTAVAMDAAARALRRWAEEALAQLVDEPLPGLSRRLSHAEACKYLLEMIGKAQEGADLELLLLERDLRQMYEVRGGPFVYNRATLQAAQQVILDLQVEGPSPL